MKVVNALLLAIALAFACLIPSASAQGVRAADNAAVLVDVDEDEEELEEDIFDRDLTKKRLKKRCAYPFEVDNDEDEECEDQSLYKPDRWCKKYCFVCPCWDLETYYDWKGNEIEDVCSEELCGRKDPELPCSKHEGEEDCCECTKCKFIEIMTWDNPLCKPDIPPPKTCEDIKPKKNDYNEWECDFDDCPRGKECVPDRNGKSCYCKSVEKECEDMKPEEDDLGFFCDAACPGDGICVPDRRNRKCECKKFCEDQREVNGRCPGECPFTGDVCVPDGDGGCTCEIPCAFDPPDGLGRCGGFCPNGEACVPGAEGESCSCKPDCEDASPRDDCDGICPGDVSGESCVEDGRGGCTCEPEIPECQPDPDSGECAGTCPFTGQACVEEDGDCFCATPCEDLSPDSDGACPGFCPFTGGICAPDGDGGCECATPCEDVEPEDGVCDAVCPTTGEACVPSDDGESCGCEPLCEFDDVAGGCVGFCPESGQSCTEDDGECVCEAPEICTLEVDKKCIVPTQPGPLVGECDGKVVQLALIWRGSTPVQVSGQQTDKTFVNPGESLTIFGPFDGNDQDLFLQSAAGSGTSTFHMSCSDREMDGPEDCGTLQGNGKKDEGGVNLWELAGLVSTDGGFDCGTLNTGPEGGEGGQDECNIVSRGVPSCDTGKPDTITFLFNGGTDPSNQCASSTIDQVPNSKGKFHTDFECSGQVDPSSPIAVQLDGGSGTVNPGQTFTVDLKSIKETTVSNGGGTQQMEFHTSCSQPIAAGLTAGALTIVGLGGQTISNQVAYTYEVTNRGDSPTIVTSVVDDQIGNIIDEPFELGPGESALLDAVDNVNTVTSTQVINVVEVTGNTVGSDEECTATDSVRVTITPGPPIGGKNKGKGKGGKNKGGGFVIGQPGFGTPLGGGNQGVFFAGGSGSGRRRLTRRRLNRDRK